MGHFPERSDVRNARSGVLPALAGEVLVPSTVKDFVACSGPELADRGERELKAVPGLWRLYSVVDG